MYIEIQHLKEKGFSNSQISEILNISSPTVIKYINMSPDEFNIEMESRNQSSTKPDIYHNDILSWLRSIQKWQQLRYMTGWKKNITSLSLMNLQQEIMSAGYVKNMIFQRVLRQDNMELTKSVYIKFDANVSSALFQHLKQELLHTIIELRSTMLPMWMSMNGLELKSLRSLFSS